MIIIRVDANQDIGIGHVMRCLSVAKAFSKINEEVIFCTADHNSDEIIKKNGFDSICLDCDWNQVTCKEFSQILYKYKPNYTLIDSYFVTKNDFNSLKPLTPIVYIDDLNVECWNVDILINYNIFSTMLDYSGYNKTQTKLMLGPQFAPLREEFKNLPKHQIKDCVSDILVLSGGSDPENVSENIIRSVCNEFKSINFHLIVGTLNPRIDKLKKLEKENVILHINEKEISRMMRKCDIAISAAGTTLYELCASGIPTITFTIADNQIMAAKQFETEKIMFNAGDYRTKINCVYEIKKHLIFLLENTKMRRKLSNKMQTIVDGKGADRIAENILGI